MNKLCLIAAVIAFFAVGCASENARRTEKFATQFKSAVNPYELQAWATNLIANAPAEKEKPAGGYSSVLAGSEINQADIPRYIRDFYKDDPPEVYVCYGDPCVSIWYNSHRCGLWVGNSSFELKSSDLLDHAYVIRWKPGIYLGDGDFGR